GGSGNQKGDKREEGQQQRNRQKSQRIGRADADKQARQKARKPQRDGAAQRDADQRQFQSLPDHQPKDVAASGAQRHPQADLARSLRRAVGDYAIDSHYGQAQTEQTKQSQQRRRHARGQKRHHQVFAHRRYFDQQAFVQSLNAVAHSAPQKVRFAHGAHVQRPRSAVILQR